MQRESNVQTLNWADKTMSVLRLQQLEACEKRLSAYLGFGLFSGCDDAHVEELWATSYEAGEQKDHNMLHTVEGLQNRVLAQLPREAALLSVQEHMLVERMLLFDGEAELLTAGGGPFHPLLTPSPVAAPSPGDGRPGT